jgi:hypothetical protein
MVGNTFAVATVLLPMNWDGRAHWNGPPLIFMIVDFPLFTPISPPNFPTVSMVNPRHWECIRHGPCGYQSDY